MSIIKSNNVGIYSTISHLIINGKDEKDVEELRRLWNQTGLEIDGGEWKLDVPMTSSDGCMYIYDGLIFVRGDGHVLGSGHIAGYDIHILQPNVIDSMGRSLKTKRALLELREKIKSSEHFVISKSYRSQTWDEYNPHSIS